MGHAEMRIRLHATRLILSAALAAAALFQSCVGDVAAPKEEPSDWINVPVPPIVRLNVNAIVSDRHGTLYLGADNGASLWRSTDRGLTWTEKTGGLNTLFAVQALLVKDGETIFAALRGGGVFISRDHGESWKQINNHLTDIETYSLCAAPGGAVLAGTENGRIFRSENDGGVWAEVETDSIQDMVLSFVTDSAGTVYAACRSQGVFCSADSGRTWSRSSSGLENLFVICLAIDGEGHPVAGTWHYGLYRCAGVGEPWVRIDGDALSGIAIYEIAADRSGAIYVSTEDHGVFRSPDGGDSWEKGDVGLQGLEVASLLPAGNTLIAGTLNYGVFLSNDDGTTWNPSRAYHPVDPFRYDDFWSASSLAIDSCGAYYLFNDLGIHRSGDGGETWVRACHGINRYIKCLAVHPDSYLLAGTDNGIYLSSDSGYSWSPANTSSTARIWVFALDVATNGTVFGGTDKGVLRFADRCASWECVFDSAKATALSTGSASRIYVGTENAGVFGSNDDGDTWRRMTDSVRVFSIAADRVGNVFAITDGGILCSGDDGNSWKTLPPDVQYFAGVAAAPGGEIAILSNSAGEICLSEDLFATWKVELTPFRASSIFLSPDGYLFFNELTLPGGMHRSRNALY